MAKRKKRYKKKLQKERQFSSLAGRKSKHIKELVEKFMLPLFPLFADNDYSNPYQALVNSFFNLQTRSLTFYRANEAFKLPGEKYVTGATTVPGTGDRAINKNELLLVVIDDTLDFVKVEICRRYSEINYKLTKFEWNHIKDKLRKIG